MTQSQLQPATVTIPGDRRLRLGMLGAGQLARMTYQAAIALDIDLRIFAAHADDSAALVARDVTVGAPDSWTDLEAFARDCDVVTFDHELTDPAHLTGLEDAGHLLRPAPATKRFAQDKAYQRDRFAALGLPVPAHEPVSGPSDVYRFGEDHGWPVVVKATRGGYDGRGVWMVADATAAQRVWRDAGAGRAPLLVEEAVEIRTELAVLIARRPGGQAEAYPLVETVQRAGICTELRVPAAVAEPVAEQAKTLGLRIADAVDAVGVLAVELFATPDDRLIVNELAARPHNSGHWTIEGSVTSQFANHVRAVLDWPLGDAGLIAPAVVTVNVLGPADGSDPRGRLALGLRVPGVAVHLYGKHARPGRKLGHVTAWGADPAETRSRARRAAGALTGEGGRQAAGGRGSDQSRSRRR